MPVQSGDCHGYFQKKYKAQIITYVASFVVLIINVILDFAVNWFTEFERHHSVDNMQRSLFRRLFLLKFFNTGIVFLISVNAARLRFIKLLLGISPSGSIPDFTAAWYSQVSVGLMIIQIGNVFSSHTNEVSHDD